VKLKLDENLSRHLKQPLAELGLEVTTAGDEGLLGRPDPEVGRAAAAEGRVLFTLDLEFADLRKYPPGSHPGIVLFRPLSMGPMFVNRFVVRFVRENELSEFDGCVVVVDPARVRVRRPPLDAAGPGWRDVDPD